MPFISRSAVTSVAVAKTKFPYLSCAIAWLTVFFMLGILHVCTWVCAITRIPGQGLGWLRKVGWAMQMSCFILHLHIGAIQPNQLVSGVCINIKTIVCRLAAHTLSLHFCSGCPDLLTCTASKRTFTSWLAKTSVVSGEILVRWANPHLTSRRVVFSVSITTYLRSCLSGLSCLSQSTTSEQTLNSKMRYFSN